MGFTSKRGKVKLSEILLAAFDISYSSMTGLFGVTFNLSFPFLLLVPKEAKGC